MESSRAQSHRNSRNLCKGLRRDGAPCQAQAHPDMDGYCIAHCSPAKLRQWRVNRGSNAATAQRLDRRAPRHLQELLDLLMEGMEAVHAGHLSPSAYNAICDGVEKLLANDRISQKEKEESRAQEKTAAAAAAVKHGDVNLLGSANGVSKKQNHFRINALAQRGPEKLDPSSDSEDPG